MVQPIWEVLRLLLGQLHVSKGDSQRTPAEIFGVFPHAAQTVSCRYYSLHVSNIPLNF